MCAAAAYSKMGHMLKARIRSKPVDWLALIDESAMRSIRVRREIYGSVRALVDG